MGYIITTLLGLVGGGTVVILFFQGKQKQLADQRRRQADQAREIESRKESIAEREREVSQIQFDLNKRVANFRGEEERFKARVVSYDELQDENTILKGDLLSLTVHVSKTELDCQIRAQAQTVLDERSKELATRYLKDNVKWIGSSLNPNNYVNCKKRLQDVIERCRGIGFEISIDEEHEYFSDLKHQYEHEVRVALEREEQARIRAQIREEQVRERETKRELERLARERQAIQAALDQALAVARDQHSEEVDRLTARLAEAEARSQRAVSQAQLTKAGHVYVISNVGSLGEGVFKVGMTRRLEPLDRICELSDASVPFPFDVHMMISSDDAPSLENALHRNLHKLRINKINPRREFFRTDIEAIHELVKAHHGEVEYLADPEALQYRQSLTMSDEDLEFIEHVYDEVEDDNVAGDEDAPLSECPTAVPI